MLPGNLLCLSASSNTKDPVLRTFCGDRMMTSAPQFEGGHSESVVPLVNEEYTYCHIPWVDNPRLIEASCYPLDDDGVESGV